MSKLALEIAGRVAYFALGFTVCLTLILKGYIL